MSKISELRTVERNCEVGGAGVDRYLKPAKLDKHIGLAKAKLQSNRIPRFLTTSADAKLVPRICVGRTEAHISC